MAAYYNEFDPGAAEWLRELIKAGHIADGEVDERSILDVRPAELAGFTQCHFFAGIGGWSYALRLAGWPDDRPVWTGSPPCQPFSAAGMQLGRDDARHLAPHFVDLVRAGCPGMLFGEQVASAEVFGKAPKRARGNAVPPPQWAWLDDLSDRLEAARYAVGASDFPSAGVGAPHIRQRTFFGAVSHEWLADSDSEGRLPGAQRGIHRGEESAGPRNGEPERSGDAGGLAHQHQHGRGASAERGIHDAEHHLEPRGGSFGLVHGLGAGLEGHGGHGDGSREPGRIDQDATGSVAPAGADGGLAERHGTRPGPLHGFWRDADWLFCRDGKWRPVEPGTFPLAHGVSGRVGLLRGYGNAINPHAAAQFIQSFAEAVGVMEAAE